MNPLADVLVQAAALVGALSVLLGATWFLLGPRIRDFLTQVARGAELSRQQLDPDAVGENAASHAKHAAEAADVLPELQEQVAANVRRLTALTLTMGKLQAAELPDRVAALESAQQLLDVAQQNTDRRVMNVEQAVIADLGRPSRDDERKR